MKRRDFIKMSAGLGAVMASATPLSSSFAQAKMVPQHRIGSHRRQNREGMANPVLSMTSRRKGGNKPRSRRE